MWQIAHFQPSMVCTPMVCIFFLFFFTCCSCKNLIWVWFYTGIPPTKYHYVDDLVVILPQNVWEYLYNRWVMHSNAHFWPLGSSHDIYHLSGTWDYFWASELVKSKPQSNPELTRYVWSFIGSRHLMSCVRNSKRAVQCKHCRVMCLLFSLAILWTYFHVFHRFGGGPAVNHLYVCAICQVEIETLAKRRKLEIDTFIKVNIWLHTHRSEFFNICEKKWRSCTDKLVCSCRFNMLLTFVANL